MCQASNVSSEQTISLHKFSIFQRWKTQIWFLNFLSIEEHLWVQKWIWSLIRSCRRKYTDDVVQTFNKIRMYCLLEKRRHLKSRKSISFSLFSQEKWSLDYDPSLVIFLTYSIKSLTKSYLSLLLLIIFLHRTIKERYQ